ncbi:VanZ family protein [Adlercreutzia sp. R21]|uniref:VanZ family protein n=1 Tax=Adlercreutzia wanghongyangiae TaxID=3111451 RepID=UPI002DBC3AEF|nr:VanZ family protein [Adlercreutzia sp. R21]MEC4184842.1 VanZ family protein [Adlercreutzia sp. R21]
MGAIKRFLGSYSDNFAAALILWPLVSLLLTLPILAYLYHRDGRLRFGSFVGTYLAVLYVLGLGCFTLYPLPSGDTGLGITYGVPANFNPLAFVGDIQKDGLKAVFQLLFNLVFFVPLGFIAGRLLRWSLLPAVLLGCATSVLIESAQFTGFFGLYPYAYRCCDVDDVIANTLGAALGWLCAWLLARVAPPGQLADAEPTDRPGFVRRCVALWIDLMIVGFATVVPYGVVALGLEATDAAALQLPGLTAAQTAEAVMGFCGLAALVLVELVIPWLRDGSTPGGSFVRMTFETHPRTFWCRVLFYIARSATLVAALWVWPWLIPLLLIFYLVKREMPYDLIP